MKHLTHEEDVMDKIISMTNSIVRRYRIMKRVAIPILVVLALVLGSVSVVYGVNP